MNKYAFDKKGKQNTFQNIDEFSDRKNDHSLNSCAFNRLIFILTDL